MSLYSSEITGIEFYVLGTHENRILSNVSVQNKELYRGSVPYADGVYDAHMGTTDNTWNCQTCHNKKQLCPGHPGSLNLRYPVQNPLCAKEILKWLRVSCFNCGEFVLPASKIPRIARNKILSEFQKIITTSKLIACPNCKTIHPLVSRDKNDDKIILLEDYGVDKKVVTEPRRLFNHTIRNILNKIPDRNVELMGKSVESHPRKFILDTIRVPPNTIRPDVKKIGGPRSSNDDVTTAIKKMVENNEIIPDVLPNVIDPTTAAKLTNMDYIYHAIIKGSSVASQKNKIVSENGAFQSIASRMPRKEGRIRTNLMGKRVRYMMRSVITCDNSLKIDEIGVPIDIAKDLQIEEIVQEYNKKHLMVFFLNGSDTYPGCSKIIRARTGETMDIKSIPKDFNLEIGDKIYRDLVNGDVMDFNRQPSLWFASIACHKIVVLDTGDTLRMNVSACILYNADFDGDCMNGIIPNSIMSRFEIENLTGFDRWFLSYQNSSAVIGVYMDGLVGMSEITRDTVRMDKFHAMRMFGQIPLYPSLTNTSYTGREIASFILPKINYTNNKPSMYSEGFAPYIKYSPNEIKVKIVNGQITSGVLDKSSIGQSSASGIFKNIAAEFGPIKALETVYHLQQLATTYLYNGGFTVSVEDLIITEEAEQEIQEITTEMIAKCGLITTSLDEGKIIPPIGLTTEETYEAMQINNLNATDSVLEPILKCLNPNNGLYKLISIGSKGSNDNFRSISSFIGQLKIDGKRMPHLFGHARTLPYFPRFDPSVASRGFISSSYKKGLNMPEFIIGAMDNRVQLINNALKTSVTGEESRKGIKNMESTIVDNFRCARKDSGIVQILYGEDGIDPRKLEDITIPTIRLNNEEIKIYHTSASKFGAKFNNKTVQQLLDAEYEQILIDRDTFRQAAIKQEKFTANYGEARALFSDKVQVPVNFKRIIDNVTAISISSKSSSSKIDKATAKAVTKGGAKSDTKSDAKLMTEVNPVEMIERIASFLKHLPYAFLNEFQEEVRGYIPQYMSSSMTLFNIVFRSYVNSYTVTTQSLTPLMLDNILAKIKLTFRQSLIDYGTSVGIIAAQSLSAPFMQSVLDSKHKAGLSGKKTKGVKRYKEIVGAKPTEKMISPSMLLFVKPEFESDESKCRSIANHIEMLPFRRFVDLAQCFFEEYENIIHPAYITENKLISDYHKYSSVSKPSDLTKWCLRYELSRNQMLFKTMKLETIVIKLSEVFKNIFWVHSPENADKIVIRGYLRSSKIKKALSADYLEELNEEIMSTTIRGINGILSANIEAKVRNNINPDGSIEESKNTWVITTDGTNVSSLMESNDIDIYNIQTDSIREVAHMYGIEAARLLIAFELKDIISKQAHRHYMSYADEMTYTGNVTSIERSGLNIREPNSSLLRMATGAPVEIIQNVGINNTTDKIHGVSGPLMVGRVPYYGTLYNAFHINEQFVETHTKSIEQILEDL